MGHSSSGIGDVARRHPVQSYYVLVFAISWGGILMLVAPGGIPGEPDDIARLFPFVLAALFVGLAVLVPSLSAKHPTIINVPSKARFLALPESARAQALEPMRDLMLFMVSPLALLALYIGLGSFRVATGAASTLSPWPVPVVVSVILAAVVVATVRTKRSIEALSVA